MQGPMVMEIMVAILPVVAVVDLPVAVAAQVLIKGATVVVVLQIVSRVQV